MEGENLGFPSRLKLLNNNQNPSYLHDYPLQIWFVSHIPTIQNNIRTKYNLKIPYKEDLLKTNFLYFWNH